MRRLAPLFLLLLSSLAFAGEDPVAERLLARGDRFTPERVAEVLSHATPPDRFRSLAEWSFERFPRHPDDFDLLGVTYAALLEFFPGERDRAESFRWLAEEGKSSYFRSGWIVHAWKLVPEDDLLRILDAWADSSDPEHRFLATRVGSRKKTPERFREVAFRLAADPERRVRFGAAEAVSHSGAARAEAFLLGRMKAETDPWVLGRVVASYGTVPVPVQTADPETLIDVCQRIGGDASEVRQVRERIFRLLATRMDEDAWAVSTRANFHRFLAGLGPKTELSAAWAAEAARAFYRDEDGPGLAKTLLDPAADQGDRIRALGALVFVGTDEALAAIDEFRRLADRRHPWPRPFRREEVREHPSPHVRGGRVRFLAETEDEDGRRFGLLAAKALGHCRLAVARAAPDDPDAFGGELVTGLPYPMGAREFALAVADGEVRISWLERKEGRVERVLALADLTRDSDEDGLTDLLERALGTDPAVADSDGDGEDDTTDPFPLLAPAPATEETEILAAAWTGLLGTSSASGLAVIDARSAPPGGLPGFPGPALVDSETLRALRSGWGTPMLVRPFGIEERAGDRARVAFGDYEGPSSAASFTVFLRKVGGRWLVSAIRMGAIS